MCNVCVYLIYCVSALLTIIFFRHKKMFEGTCCRFLFPSSLPVNKPVSVTELAGEGSVPVLSSPRRSNLAFLRVGSAACGNSELKVRHKYGAKRVLKLGFFFPLSALSFIFWEQEERAREREGERGCKTRLACAFVQSGVCTSTGHRSGSKGSKWRRGELKLLFLKEGRCETGLRFFFWVIVWN